MVSNEEGVQLAILQVVSHEGIISNTFDKHYTATTLLRQSDTYSHEGMGWVEKEMVIGQGLEVGFLYEVFHLSTLHGYELQLLYQLTLGQDRLFLLAGGALSEEVQGGGSGEGNVLLVVGVVGVEERNGVEAVGPVEVEGGQFVFYAGVLDEGDVGVQFLLEAVLLLESHLGGGGVECQLVQVLVVVSESFLGSLEVILLPLVFWVCL